MGALLHHGRLDCFFGAIQALEVAQVLTVFLEGHWDQLFLSQDVVNVPIVATLILARGQQN